MAAAASAAAAAARRNRIRATGAFGVVVTVTSVDFARAIEMEPEPVVVRSVVKRFWSGEVKNRYLSSVKGIAFFCEDLSEVALPEGVIVIEADKITVPSDL